MAVAVYKKITAEENDSLHQSFLKSIGGQSTFRCLAHRTWLVQKHSSDGVTCDQNDCKNKGKWVCPQSECNVAVCSKHSKDACCDVNFIESAKNRPLTKHNVDDNNITNEERKTADPFDAELSDAQVNFIYEPSQFLTSAVDISDSNVPIVQRGHCTC